MRRLLNTLLTRAAHNAVLIVCVLLGLAAAHPLLIAGRLPRGHDSVHHLLRLVQFDALVRQGVLFPRWAPDLLCGYGYPLFNYVPTLSLVPPQILVLLGISHASAMRIGLVAALVIAAIGAFLWARGPLGQGAALAAAAAYVFSPYLLSNLMTRMAVAEVWALGLLPLALHSVRLAVTSPTRRRIALLAVMTAAMGLLHNVTFALFLLIAAGYILALWLARRKEAEGSTVLRAMAWPALAMLLGVGAVAFYWLPATLEGDQVQVERLFSADWAHWRANLVNPRTVFSFAPPLNWISEMAGGYYPFVYYVPNLSPIPAILGVAGILFVIRSRSRELAAHLGVLTLVLGVSLFTASPASAPVWANVPQMALIQHPWRMLGPAALSLAWLCGLGVAGICRAPESRRLGLGPLFVGLTVAGLFVYGANWQTPTRWHDPMKQLSAVDMCALEQQLGTFGTTGAGEYLPVAVAELPPQEQALDRPQFDRLDRTSLPNGAQALELGGTQLQMQARLDLPSEARLVFRVFYFPGWRALVNGRAVNIVPTAPHGLISFTVPAGVHSIEVAFGSTPLRDASWAISGLSVAILIGLILWPRRPGGALAAVKSRERPGQLWGTWGLALVLLGLVLLGKWAVVDPWLAAYPHVTPPGARWVPFTNAWTGDSLALVGVTAPRQAASGGSAQVGLYWRALDQRPATDHALALYVLDERGQDAGWARTHQPLAHVPTSLWYPGDLYRDVIRLQIPPGTPPGAYRVRLELYPSAAPESAFDPVGVGPGVYGRAYEVATLQVTRPRRAIDADALGPAVRLEQPLSPALTLLGHSELPQMADQGDTIPLALYWRAEQEPGAPVDILLGFVNNAGQTVHQVSVPPVPLYGTEHWRAGDVWRGLHLVRVPPSLVGPHTLTVRIGDLSPVTLGELDVVALPRAMTRPAVAESAHVRFADLVTLVGYELSPIEPHRQALRVTLVWRAERETEDTFKVFVHLVDLDGQLVAQSDAEPVNWERPTTTWVAGEYLVDEHILSLSATMPAGEYVVRVGLYNAATGQRLTTELGGDHWTLDQPLEVVP